jgi:hypothetical protein
MFFGQNKPTTEVSDNTKIPNDVETGISFRDFDPSEGLPGALPPGVTRIETDNWDALPEDIRQQLAGVDFSGTRLKQGLKEAIEDFQNNNVKPVTNAPLGTSPKFSVEDIKKVNYNDLTTEQQFEIKTALKQFSELAVNSRNDTSKNIISNNNVETKPTFDDFTHRIDSALDQLMTSQNVSDEVKQQIKAEKPVEDSTPITESGYEPVSGRTNAITTCPHCLRDVTQVAVPISEQNKTDFLLAVVTGKPYTERLSLFDGRILIDLASLTTDKSDFNLIAIERLDNDPNIPEAIKPSLFNRVFVAGCVSRIQIGDTRIIDLPEIPIGVKSMEECYQVLLNRFNIVKDACHSVDMVNVLIDACYRFYDRYRRMQQLATDPNFWKPTPT